MKDYQARVVSNTMLFTGASIIWFEQENIARSARPGQFVMIKCGPENLLRRPLAVHRIDARNNQFAVLFAVAGKGTRWLAGAQIGETVNILGPAGNSFKFAPGSQNILLVTGGLGIAPLTFLIDYGASTGKSMVLLQGAQSGDCLYPAEYLPADISCHVATEDGSSGSKCLVTGLVHNYIGWADQIIACGPTAMYHTIARQNKQLFKTKPFQVSLEARMGCGFGACYGCSVPTRDGMKKVCHDGPVFEYEDILWEKPAT